MDPLKQQIRNKIKCAVIVWDTTNPGFIVFRVWPTLSRRVKTNYPEYHYIGNGYFKIEEIKK